MNKSRTAAGDSSGETEVDFGFEHVSPEEKTRRVRAVFDSVAESYDVMNDLMSFGLHRLWKRLAVMAARVRPGNDILDLAGGTGDLGRLFARRTGARGRVIISDINGDMLRVGRDRLLDEGGPDNVSMAQANAELLPFPDRSFDVVSIAFGLFRVLPRVGKIVAKDADSYRYLAESIRMHPNQDSLLAMMQTAGFEQCRYRNMAGGIVALHDGIRL